MPGVLGGGVADLATPGAQRTVLGANVPPNRWQNPPMSLPAVSVLLPVYNAARFLDGCLESLAAQTLTAFEIVAVDDGSTDGSAEILDRWRRREPRLRVLTRSHGGLITALNHGLGACHADVVARMDADDESLSERLELQRELLDADPGLDVVSCQVRHFADDRPVGRGLRVYERWLNGLVSHEDILRERFIESPLPHPSVMVRRSALEEANGYRDRGWPEDYDLWLRLAEAGHRFVKVPRELVRWRDHGDRLTRRHRRYAVERFLECKAHFLARGPLAGIDRLVIWGAGQTGRRLSKHLIRRGHPPGAFIDVDERKCGRTVRGAPVHPPDDLAALVAAPGRALVLTAVSSRGARELIRARLVALGLVETRDFWCVA